jgi:hypothetical protein
MAPINQRHSRNSQAVRRMPRVVRGGGLTEYNSTPLLSRKNNVYSTRFPKGQALAVTVCHVRLSLICLFSSVLDQEHPTILGCSLQLRLGARYIVSSS